MIEFLKETAEEGILLELVDGKLKLFFEGENIDPIRLQQIKDKKQEIVTFLTKNQELNENKEEANTDIPKAPKSDAYPISDAQRRLWILNQFEPDSATYNMPHSLPLKGDYDIERLEQSIQMVIERHEILRTHFHEDEEGVVTQIIQPSKEFKFSIDKHDYTEEIAPEQSVYKYIQADRNKGFDLQNGPLLRAALLKVADGYWFFHYNMHHIISDGWSMEVLKRDVLTCYSILNSNKSDFPEPLRIQYKDYAVWQLNQLQSNKYKQHKDYWTKQLLGNLTPINFESAKKRPTLRTTNGHTFSTWLNSDQLQGLRKFSEENGGTLFMGFIASFNALLYRYTGERNLILGCPVTGRDHADLSDQIGFYVNTLVLKNQLLAEDNFLSFFDTVKNNTLEAFSHQEYPFDRLVEDLKVARDTSRNAIFDIMISYHTFDIESGLVPDKSVLIQDAGVQENKFDLDISFEERNNEVQVKLNFNTDLFNQDFIKQFLSHYLNLLTELLQHSNMRIDELNFLSTDESKQLLTEFNPPVFDKVEKTLVRLFEEQVEKNPENEALLFQNKTVDYAQLNNESNQLARWLRVRFKIVPNDRVGVKLTRNSELIVALLGVLKSGAAYVPIDPNLPEKRIEFIRIDSACKLILDEEILKDFHLEKQVTPLEKENLPALNSPQDLAYIIYTSGSTGKPKGVMVAHESIATKLFAEKELIGFEENHLKTSFNTNFGFDVSLLETFLPLSFGGSIAIPSSEQLIGPVDFVDFLAKSKVNILQGTPGFIRNFVTILEKEELKNINDSLKTICVGGEALPFELIKEVEEKLPAVQLNNHYGPTETVIDAIALPNVKTKDEGKIGKPLPDVVAYVLNEKVSVQPIGVPGEICLGGNTLALGYLNREVLTNESFVDFSHGDTTKIYKSGDLGYWTTEGELVFLGRKDKQVKIRGYRIELGEVKSALLGINKIQEAEVLTVKNQAGENELVAFFVSNEKVSEEELKKDLQQKLPTYMVPTFWCQVEEIPLTPNGKVDDKYLLSRVEKTKSASINYVAPVTAMEKSVVKIWKQVLEADRIGLTDDFFAIGGHSLKAVRLSNFYRKELGFKLSLSDLFKYTTILQHVELFGSIEQNKFEPIPNIDEKEDYAISDAQRRLWVISQLAQSESAYHMPGNFYLNQELNIKNFELALKAVIERHEVLRTVFVKNEKGEIRQKIRSIDELEFSIGYEDLRFSENKAQRINAFYKRKSQEEFDLENGPLVRADLIQLEEESYLFHYNMHHIIGDGWSLEILFKEVLSFYETLQKGEELNPEPLRIQYKDYAEWQRGMLESEPYTDAKKYWLQYLAGELAVIDLPTTKSRPAIQTNNGHKLMTCIDSETNQKLKNYVKENGGSVFMTLVSVWNTLLYRYASQKDIVIGIPLAGRSHPDLENQIGCYVNTLPLRTQIDQEISFAEFYQKVKENITTNFNNQMYPFDRMVEELDLQRDTSRSPVFDITFSFQASDREGENYAADIIDQGHANSKFDISVAIEQVSDYMELHLVFNTDVYEKNMMEQFIGHYKRLLNLFLEDDQTKIAEIEFLSADQRNQLLVNFNQTEKNYPTKETLVSLFEKQVEKTPEKVAICVGAKDLTYRELNESANQLANYLNDKFEITPKNLIGIKQERNEHLIISILATLKLGAAYVPIDPSYPSERINFILEDSACKLCLDEAEMDLFEQKKLDFDSKNLNKSIDENQCAYVIYTSGSTGQPKGVKISHASICNLCFWHQETYEVNEKSRATILSGVGFDAMVWELFPYITTGATVYPISNNDRADVDSLLTIVNSNEITHAYLPTVLYNDFAQKSDDLYGVINVCVGGEALGAVKAVDNIKLHNNYGPTENTVVSTKLSLSKSDFDKRNIPIGKPISNSKIYVLNEKRKLQPQGVVGEICIAGKGVSLGYLNQPQLTAEKFVDNPYEAGKLYLTGDLGRFLSDGTIEFAGRKDDQVKIRGYRIELGEVESAIEQLSFVNKAVVITLPDTKGAMDLVAYYTSEEAIEISVIRDQLKQRLPQYMIPAFLVRQEEFPLTQNGKIDKRSLPNPLMLGLSRGADFVAPRNEKEIKMAQIWTEVLEQEQVGIKDDFFTLGGHSLKAVKLIGRYAAEFGVKLKLQDLFTVTTIESQVRLLGEKPNADYQKINPIQKSESYQVSDAQRRMWVLSQFEGSSAVYNIPGSIQLERGVDIKNFIKAIEATIDRHEILRTVIKEDESGELRQWVKQRSDIDFKVDYKDYRLNENPPEEIKAFIKSDEDNAFSLNHGPLIRVALLQQSNDEIIFYYNLHHIISDGWSMEVLSKDIMSYYNSFQSNELPNLLSLDIQYKDFSAWQFEQYEKTEFKLHQEYWLKTLGGNLPLFNLYHSKQRPKIKSNEGRALYTEIDAVTTRNLQNYTNERGGSLFMGLLAVWNVLMYRNTHQNELIVGTPVAGRAHPDLENQIGLYLNTLALRNEIKENEGFNVFFDRLKQNTLESFDHSDYPFDRLVDELDLTLDTSRNAVFDVMLSLQNFTEAGDVNGTYVKEIKDLGKTSAKFDLDITFQERGDRISFHVIYNSDIYEAEMIRMLLEQYKNLLETVLTNPDEQIAYLDYLPAQEKQLITSFNGKNRVNPELETFQSQFEKQVLKTPENIALVSDGKTITYKELNELSNRMAHFLIDQYKVKEDSLVGIFLERNEWNLVSILGVLKSGAAYLPIDPEYPKERIEYMEKDGDCLVTIDKHLIDQFRTNVAQWSCDNPKIKISPESLAYVIYTSGTSGKPKGVMIENKSLLDYAITFGDYFNVEEQDAVIQQASLSFDTHVEEIYPVLLRGGKVVLAKNGGRDIEELIRLVQLNEATVLSATPMIISELNERSADLSGLRLLISGGDKFNLSFVSNFVGQFQIYDTYGPSEATVCSTYSKIIGNEEQTTIGKPIKNRSIYILNEQEQIVPIGATGEIYIGGEGVARGYLNQPQLTNESFIQSPFLTEETLYKTGDLGRWHKDGRIEFIGRKDSQVKIRGYRVELGEIESALLQLKGVQDAAVIVQKTNQEENYLIAYTVLENDVDADGLKRLLSEKLPAYMIPVRIFDLDKIPQTPNGKVDKKALSLLNENPEELKVPFVGPQNETQKTWLDVWEQVLNRAGIGIDDDFFELGGNSIKAVSVSRAGNLQVPLKTIYKERTIRRCLAAIEIQNSTETLLEHYPAKVKTDKNIVLVPYAGATDIAYQNLAQVLTNDFNVYTVIMPWHSLVDDVEYKGYTWVKENLFKEVEERVKGKTIVLGHCAGTSLALVLSQFIEHSKETLVGLIQCADSYNENYNFDLNKGGWSSFSNEEIWNDVIVKLDFQSENLHEKTKEAIVNNLRHDAHISERLIMEIQGNKKAMKLNAPIHALYGEQDSITPNYKQTYKSWNLFSDVVSFDAIPYAGHYFVNQNAAETVEKIKQRVNDWSKEN